MNLTDEIRANFARGFFGLAMEVQGLPPRYPAWTVKEHGRLLAAVPLPTYRPFYEKFASIVLSAQQDADIGGRQMDLLTLVCRDRSAADRFACICADFVDPGQDGMRREELIADPAAWWKGWADTLGNVSSRTMPYDVLAELLVLERMQREGENPLWSGPGRGTHDIEGDTASAEVKSTTSRYGCLVPISSLYQLMASGDRPLFLHFLRLEHSQAGVSIQQTVRSLVRLGRDPEELERALEHLGLPRGRPAREETWRVLEWKRFPVDSSFPLVTEKAFKLDRVPPRVVHFVYTLDLAGMPGENML